MSLLHATPFQRLLARITTLLFIGVLLCVPGLTRVSQRISTSPAPRLSFSKSTECPPKKMAVTRTALETSGTFLYEGALAATTSRRWLPDVAVPISPTVFSPRPLRAPPASPLA